MLFQTVHLAGEGMPELDCYVQDPAIATGVEKVRPAIVICPGGAYLKCAHREGEVVAMRFAGMGYHTFVLRYHTYVTKMPSAAGEQPELDADSHYPLQVVDLMRAMAYVHAHAAEWRVDPDRVYAMGFSAGGHVVGSLVEHWDDPDLLAAAGASADAARPRGALLCYPMVDARLAHDAAHDDSPGAALVPRAIFGTDAPTEQDFARLDLAKHVRPDMPRLFVWQTAEDGTLHAADTVRFVAAAMEAGVSCELHLFQKGRHGLSLADETSANAPELVNPAASAWPELARTWLALDA